MSQGRFLFIIAVLEILITSCIKRYNPEINSNEINKYVVSGEVIKGNTIQNINVSQTAPIGELYYKYYVPVKGCEVRIVDQNGNSYYASDTGKGNYEANIPQNRISIGSAFKVEVIIPVEGEDYKSVQLVSDYDTLQECPEIDSLYYLIEKLPSVNPYIIIRGIRFSCDLDATKYSCRNFRFEETETWEYKAIFAKDASRKYCWLTNKINSIFTLSTKNLSQNKFKMYPFHFVDNYSTQRLKFGYSLLLQQYSLSDAAFVYCEKIRTNGEDHGGMYEKQPHQITGNMHNLTRPDLKVLGFFGASDMKLRRLFVGKIDALPIEYLDCDPTDLYPEPTCFDCLLEGGTNIKPAFWPY